MISNDEICPECGASMSDVSLDPDDGTLTCPECDYQYELPGMFQSIVRSADLPSSVDKDEVSPSDYEAIDVTRGDDDLRIDLSWRSSPAFVFALVGLGGTGVGGLVTYKALTAYGPVADHAVGLTFGLVFLLGSGALVYWAAAALLNSTAIRVGHGRLSVEYGPLPWWGETDIETAPIEQIFCTSHTNSTGDAGNSVTTFRVNANTANGGPIALVDKIAEPVDALGIEREIESWLGLEDESVDDEFASRG